jgi:dolichyl-phosphate beta-glucosyltransferase
MISVVIPAFNEEKRIAASLNKLSRFLEKRKEKFEIIVVDDASTDHTGQIVKRFTSKIPNLKVIRLDKSPYEGKGLAVNRGALAAAGEVVVFTDADFSTPIEEIDKILRKIDEGFDVAVGSRAVDRSLVRKRQGLIREFIGRIFNLLVQLLVIKGIRDTQCGFKAFKMPQSRVLFEKEKIFDFGFDVEILFLAKRNGLKIAEVPVLWYNHPASRVHPIKDAIAMFLDLIKVRLYHAKKEDSLIERIFYSLYHQRTIVRFIIVGASGTLVDYSVFYLLTRMFLLNPLVANPIAVETAILWNFFWNNRWTFAGRVVSNPIWKRFLLFQFVSLGGLLLSQNSLFIFNRLLNIFDLFAKALTIPIVASFNYVTNSRWTFRDISRGKALWYVYTGFILLLLLLYLILNQ